MIRDASCERVDERAIHGAWHLAREHRHEQRDMLARVMLDRIAERDRAELA